MLKSNKNRLKILYTFNKNRGTYYHCICTCGNEKDVHSGNLKRTHSCGCLNSEMTKKRMTTHGLRYTDEYRIWSLMKNRCSNSKNPKYYMYGERGITVSKPWLKFENFYKDMGRRPSKNHSIHRINNFLGYSKENCRWATKKEQANNTRRNHMITFNGKTQSLKMWADELNLNYDKIKSRLYRNYTFERAIL